MGYFSELDLEQRYYSHKPEPTRLQKLETKLLNLREQLEDLEELRPHDPLDPMFDRWFYADSIDDLSTAQGLLRAIRAVETQIANEQNYEADPYRWWSSVLKDGETPDGQVVLTQFFYPQFVMWLTAA